MALYTHVDGDYPVAASFNQNFLAINTAVRTVLQGGTGITSFGKHDILAASGTTALTRVSPPAGYALLQSPGTTLPPVWSTNLLAPSTAGHVMGSSVSSTKALVSITSGFTPSTTAASAGLAVRTNLTPSGTQSGFLLDVAGDITKRAGATHPLFAGVAIQALGVTSAAGSVLNTSSLYIAGTMGGTLVAGGTNYALWVDDGISRFDSTILGSSAAVTGAACIVGGITISGTTGLYGVAATGTPAQYAGYQDNLGVMAWLRCTGTTNVVQAGFNISSITRLSAGYMRIAWQVAFANSTSYAIFCAGGTSGTQPVVTSVVAVSASTCEIGCGLYGSPAVTQDPAGLHVMAVGL